MTRALVIVTCLCVLITLASCRTTQGSGSSVWQNIAPALMNYSQQRYQQYQSAPMYTPPPVQFRHHQPKAFTCQNLNGYTYCQ